MAEDKSDEELSPAEIAHKAMREGLQSVFERPITTEEFYYLLSRYPYLELCNSDYPYMDDVAPKVIQKPNGWQVYDYGSVLCMGANALDVETLLIDKGADDEGEGGTVIKQASDIVSEMIAMAKERGWPAADLISGFYPLQRLAWILAEKEGFTLNGFEATPEDRVVQNWIRRLDEGKMYPPEKAIVTRKGLEFD